jgi:hypothetical protein
MADKKWKSNNPKLIFPLSIAIVLSVIVVFAQKQENSAMQNLAVTGLDKHPHVAFAGVRSSSYGIRPFPDADAWVTAMQTMSSYFEGSTPCAIWIVGQLSKGGDCRLFFPSQGKSYEHIRFNEVDKHEAFLEYFDKAGVKVFLQVEPGNADISILLDLVLERYGHHSCVIGFGVDVEWNRESEKPGWGMPVSDDEAEVWEQKIKSYNPVYKLFLKHWDREWMPPTYRGDIIFISDSQELDGLDAMVNEFADYWAKYFKPNPVYFQIGYRSDREWWKNLETPPKALGEAIVSKVEQETGIFWVDFTLREVHLVSD